MEQMVGRHHRSDGRVMADPDLCPWPDFHGCPIRHGDRLEHSNGQTFTAVRLVGHDNPGEAWRAVYDEDPQNVSRLCLQIGDKGMAVLKTPGIHAPQ
ncbi:MAG TPA: hypothetical protein VMA55_12485 [Acidovorax sp.]|nr:hypothetical protein [Acidovorax sp.]